MPKSDDFYAGTAFVVGPNLVMTNRHCRQPNTVYCDPRQFALAGYSERQMLVEGWSYTPHSEQGGPNHGPGGIFVPYWKPDLLRLNDKFINSPDQQSADQVRKLGVKWILIDRTQAKAASATTLKPWAQLRFALTTVEVYELTSGR